MTMKKIMTNIKTLAALLIASATLAACSSDDNEIQNAQPVNPTEPQVYTMTIQATKATGGATTRGLSLDGTKHKLTPTWNEGEEVVVVQMVGTTNTTLGTLKAKASNDGVTTLTGKLTGLQAGAQLKFYLHGSTYGYTGQTGVLLSDANSIEKKYDYAFFQTTDYVVNNSTVTVASGINLEAQQSIVKFTFVDNNGNAINAKSLEIETTNPLVEKMNNIDGTGNSQVKSMTITPASATNVIYAAIPNTEPNKDRPNDYTLTVTDGNGKLYTYTKNVTFTNGKYYEVKVKMPKRCTLAKSTVGMIVGTDGLAYYVEDKDNLPTDVTAAGMVAYKNGSKGLVIALTNMDSEKMWYNSINEANTYKPEVKGQTWKVPSVDEWKLMIGANNDDGNDNNFKGLNTAIEKAGGTALQKLTSYWTSTHKSPDIYYMSIDSDGDANFNPVYDDEGASIPVRVCFDF